MSSIPDNAEKLNGVNSVIAKNAVPPTADLPAVAGFAREEGFDDVPPAIRSSLQFPVVGIGASAGGITALLSLFEHMPDHTGMAFVVILHLSPQHDSKVDQILQRVTRMPVQQVFEPTHIEADHVYVIPPTKDLSMSDSYLRVTDQHRPRGRHVAIDLFFRTLAQAHRERSIGVVLSGTGADGSLGLGALKEQGGVSIAQTPEDAEFGDMPLNAIATGLVDVVLPAAEIAGKLVQLWNNARRIELPDSDRYGIRAEVPPDADAAARAEESLRDVMALLRARTGNEFRHYKRATVLRRIERRLQVNALPDLPAYREYLAGHADEIGALLQDMLISVTSFFRDREAFEALEREVVSQLLESRPTPEQVRVWVAGCATGEEAYSLSMMLSEHAAAMSTPAEIQVFASDIDLRAIAVGRAGLYPEAIVTDVPPTRLRQFFQKENGQYRIQKKLRDTVLFAEHNILRDPPFSRLDVVSCRNLLIYLERDVQTHVLKMFHFALKPGGLLFLGGSESAEAASAYFTLVDKKHRIFRANDMARSMRPIPLLPGAGSAIRLGITPASTALAIAPARPPYEQLHRRLLEQYAPPSVLVDAQSTIVQMSDRAGRFLRHVGGTPTHNLLTVALPELRPELRSALFHARQSGESVEARRLQVERDGRLFFMNMTVHPVQDEGSSIPLWIVLFNEAEATLTEQPAAPAQGDSLDPVVQQLEQELQKMSGQMQSLISESEASNEELRASNEELQAINEELRSATEELETSKEELQSLNEELTTVNAELKDKVEETGKTNDDLQNLIASSDIATVFIDSRLRIKRYTPTATEVFNLIASDIGRSLLDLTHRLDYAGLADDVAEAFETLKMIHREVRATENRWYLVRLSPYRTLENRIDGAVITLIDITARRHAEETLRRYDERLRLMAESTKDYAIITLDVGGRVTSWNEGAERMFGHTEQDMLGDDASRIFTPEDRAAQVPSAELRKARDEGRAEDERWHLHKDGRRLYCSGIVTPLTDGTLQGYAKIARDFTDSKVAERQRDAVLTAEKNLREELEAANAMKDEFLAVMSHELKNPLNLIQLNAEILSRLPEAQDIPAVKRAAAIISRTVGSQAQIIDDLLDLSRMNTGKLALNRAPVEVMPVIQRIVDTVAGEAQSKRLTIDVEAETTANTAAVVYADSIRVEQVLWNLISNAMKFTPAQGSIHIRVTTETSLVRIDVIDNGRGIESHFVEHVFDMFRQENSRINRQQGGLGIGLALVKHLTELHGGHVEAASEGLGRGSRFSVWLPLHQGTPAMEPGSGARSDGALSGLRMLVVDDADESLEAFCELLKIEGADVTFALGAQEGLDIASRQDFDLLISDIAMPGMDGYALIHALRTQERTRQLPAIAATGFGRASDQKRALESGFDAHIGKPIALNKLLKVIDRVLGNRRSRSG